MHQNRKLAWIPLMVLLCGGCRVGFAQNTPFARLSDNTIVQEGRCIIRAKNIANLSEDRTTITLSVDAYDPGSGPITYRWDEVTSFGNLNTTRGAVAQWQAESLESYTATIRVTVTGDNGTESAEFQIPVKDGKIQPAELMPEVSLTPQSAVLIKGLPTAMKLTGEALEALKIRTKLTLSATCYQYDPISNRKYNSLLGGDLTWSTSAPSLVVVDEQGEITPADGCEVGEAVITVTSKQDSGCKASIPVKVGYLDTAVSLQYLASSLYVRGLGKTSEAKLVATVCYRDPNQRGRLVFTDTESQEISWSSSDPAIAQVDSQGNLRVLEDATAGIVVITARSDYDPTQVATVSIAVKDR